MPQPVAHGRKLHRRHRVEKARRQASEPPIAEAGVRFLLEKAEPVETPAPRGFVHDRIEQKVRDVVGQRAADEELHGQVVDALGVLSFVGLLGAHPALRQDISHRAGGRLELLPRACRDRVDDVVEEEVPLVEPVGRTRELNRATSVLFEQRLDQVDVRPHGREFAGPAHFVSPSRGAARRRNAP
jgi:hypothetical protein